MREHLLGYLIGALDPDEANLVERHLKQDPGLQRDLELLRVGLQPLEFDNGHYDPPPGLAERTCRFVEMRRASLNVEPQAARAPRWGFQDMLIAAGILMAASMLFFPALNQSRFQAQRRICQDNLRRIGTALVQYSMAHKNQFPYVPPTGKLASAGLYAPILFHSGYVTEKHRFLCPGCDRADANDFDIPTLDALMAASTPEREQMQRVMGGSYSYTWGHLENGAYVGTTNLGRHHFALLSDAPCTTQAVVNTNSSNHAGSGQNVLFEDGHVQFLITPECHNDHGCDNIFANDAGVLGPGLTADDAVIPPAWVQPTFPASTEVQ